MEASIFCQWFDRPYEGCFISSLNTMLNRIECLHLQKKNSNQSIDYTRQIDLFKDFNVVVETFGVAAFQGEFEVTGVIVFGTVMQELSCC